MLEGSFQSANISAMKKKSMFTQDAPHVEDINDANALIKELWDKLREYEDKLATSSRNSSRSPSNDTPEVKAERKKLKRLVAEMRQALNLDTRGIDDH
jgi:SMC interacting uncharacterized protein involved in chromosome segregation